MKEQINELKFKVKEETPKDKEKGEKRGIEITKGEEMNKVIESIEEIKDRIEHDKPIKGKDVLKAKEAINNLTVDINGEKVLIKNIKNIENLKENIEIFKEIEQGNLDNMGKLTFLSKKSAESLSKHEGMFDLDGLKSLTDKSAESLSKHEGMLNLEGLKSLTDKSVESLSKHEGKLFLSGLESITDKSAESLSKHKGWLDLRGLKSITDKSAESLSKHKGNIYVPDEIQKQIDKFKK